MPVSYELDRAGAFIYTRCTENVTLDEVMDHFRELEADATLPSQLDVLLDLTAMDSLPESDQVKSVAAEVARMRRKVRWGSCAIVATRDALYGMARMFEVLAEDFFANSRVFRETEEAQRWLSANRVRSGT